MAGIEKRSAWRLPAEWEPHEATWLAWPHNRKDWPGKFQAIPWVYSEIVRKIAPGEKVRILVNSEEFEKRARSVLDRAQVDMTRVEFYPFPTDRVWTRDYCPFFLQSSGKKREIAARRFQFNAWARYPNWQRDAEVPSLIAKQFEMNMGDARHHERPVVLEGGAVDCNGQGALLATEECLLDDTTQVRNPGTSREEMEEVFREFLGIGQTLWLGKGIAGDDTHCHVDDLCRFVSPDTVVLCREDNPSDPNHRPLSENRERLQGVRLENGATLKVIDLPMPHPLFFEGVRLPASYANFYISNAAVLVPTFNDAEDRVALGILGELFPDRPVVGIHAVDLVWGLGTLHCMTHEQPAGELNLKSKTDN